jgi:hypothetical protein
MSIVGIENMTPQDLKDQVSRGGKFVVYQYCISIIILTFKRPSKIYFIRAGENAIVKGLPFLLLSFIAGWWGFPWGIIYTIQSLFVNLQGGRDVTADVLPTILPGQQTVDIFSQSMGAYSASSFAPTQMDSQTQPQIFKLGAWFLVGLTGLFALIALITGQWVSLVVWIAAVLLMCPPLRSRLIAQQPFLKNRFLKGALWGVLMVVGVSAFSGTPAVSAFTVCSQPQQEVCSASSPTLMQNPSKLYLSGKQTALDKNAEFTVTLKPTKSSQSTVILENVKAKVKEETFLLELEPKQLPAGTYQVSLASKQKVGLPKGVTELTVWAAEVDRLMLCAQPETCKTETTAFAETDTSIYLLGQQQQLKDGTEFLVNLKYTSEPQKQIGIKLAPVQAKVKDQQVLLEIQPKKLAVGSYEIILNSNEMVKFSGNKTFTVWSSGEEAKAVEQLPISKLTFSKLAMCDRTGLPQPKRMADETVQESDAELSIDEPNFCMKDSDRFSSKATALGFRLDIDPAIDPARIKISWRAGSEVIVKPSITKLSGRSRGLNYTLSAPDGFPKGDYELLLSLQAKNAQPIVRKFTID